MTPLSLTQYLTSEPRNLTTEELRSLLTAHSKRIEVRPADNGLFTLKGLNHVGLIHADQLEIMIQPKVPPLSVFWMLGFADGLVKFSPPEFAFEEEAGLLDVLARLFAKRTEAVIRRGIYRAYVEREENLRFVRGRILPLSDLRVNQGLRHLVSCRYSDHTADVLHNQILLSVTEQLLRLHFRLPGIHELLAWNAAHLGEVSHRSLAERDFAGLRYGRLDAHYMGVHALARLVLRHVTFEFEAGLHPAPSFLVNMNRVFEEFVRQLVQEEALPRGLKPRATANLRLDVAGIVPVKPDIVLTDGIRIRAAIDVKYKVENPQADVYQALAYAKGLGLSRVALVYPGDGEVAPAIHRIRNDNVEVLVRTVSVGHHGAGFQALERRARAEMNELLTELTPEHTSRLDAA